MRRFATLFGVVSLCFATTGHAQLTCDGNLLPTAAFLPDVRSDAIAVRSALCIDGGTRPAVLDELIAFVQKNNGTWFATFGGFEGNADPLQVVRVELENQREPPTIGVTVNAANEDLLSVTANGATTTFRPAMPEMCSAQAQGRPCGDVLDEFMSFYTYAHTTYASESALAFAKQVSGLSADWDEYLKSSRSQTPLELAINSAIFKHNETTTFMGPPKNQWIVLHPSLVVENAKDAIDGETAKTAVMLELFGLDRWRQGRWFVPTGGSIVGVYSDRPGVKDAGYGVALHFRHTYSLGFADHDGDSSVFVSFDLLKLLQDKQKVLGEYKKAFDE